MPLSTGLELAHSTRRYQHSKSSFVFIQVLTRRDTLRNSEPLLGKIAISKLTTENIASFSEQIPYESLCKTFQDFFATVKRFSLEYVWIDSLCIIQDDDDDWRRESSLMV
jgi:hypothetical protein